MADVWEEILEGVECENEVAERCINGFYFINRDETSVYVFI